VSGGIENAVDSSIAILYRYVSINVQSMVFHDWNVQFACLASLINDANKYERPRDPGDYNYFL